MRRRSALAKGGNPSRLLFAAWATLWLGPGCAVLGPGGSVGPAEAREPHLGEIRQLSRGQRENAEAYYSFDGRDLIFQSNRPPHDCDQIYRVPIDASEAPKLVSTGQGRTTCAYFFPGDERILYSSTHLADPACPAAPDRSNGYVWPLYPGYDIFVAGADGADPERLTDTPGYDAEATVCPLDGSIVFTSVRDGDLDLYRMDADGNDVVRLTETPGYDGGAFFSRDCTKIVWRASRPKGDALDDYQRLLAQGLVRPGKLEIYVANADGSDARQVTYLDAASFGPYFFPSGQRIIFSSNYGDPSGREFDLWAVDTDGTDLERITRAKGFDGFPMFSPDGTHLVFGSNRNQKEPGETDIYIARWHDDVASAGQKSAADRFQADVEWLADDARQGRGIGTAGLDAAADWLESRFRALGLEGVYGGGGYRQAIDVAVAAERGAETSLVIDGAPIDATEFVPAGFSASQAVSGELILAGHGISGEDVGDDYRDLQTRGKIVLVRRFTPTDGAFEDEKLQRRYSDLRYKAWNAREHGAAALLVVDAPAVRGDEEMPEEAPLPPIRADRHGTAGLPVMFVSRAVGQKLMQGRHEARLRVALRVQTRPAFNIVGRIPAGSPERLDGAILVGAHYDHLGMGGEDSLANPHGDAEPEVHNGADDNASGTAALLEIARSLMRRRSELRRDVYIAAFTAEETGIFGSTAFVKASPEGARSKELVAMLNMDMVGRMRENRLSVIGAKSAEEWADIVEPACAASRVECSLGGDGYGPSDQTPFYAAGVPVLHLFTGAHRQYHSPSDDADTINAAGGARVAAIVRDLTLAVASREPLSYAADSAAPEPEGDVRAYGASMGTIPDYTETSDPGVVLAGTRREGAAYRAGLRRGDRIVQIGSHRIDSIHDMVFVLRAAKPGEQTQVVVVRDEERLGLPLTYGKASSRRR